jgi:hypothetical protein
VVVFAAIGVPAAAVYSMLSSFRDSD